MFLSQFLHYLSKIITPIVTGIVVTTIGLSLIKVAVTDMCGGAWLLKNDPESFGSFENLGLSLGVLIVIVLLNKSKIPFLRMSSIIIGLFLGYIAAAFMGKVSLSGLGELPLFSIPIPFKYGFSFNLTAFIPIAFIYIITTIESIGDLTATSMVSGEPIEGDVYMKRVQGGVLGDGFNSALAAMFNTFPNTTLT